MPKAKAPVRSAKARFILKKDVEPKLVGKWYPTEDVPKPVKRAFKPTGAKLRAGLKPGTVVILLAGRFKGKRAVFLKQLPSGLLLVTGPYAVNGVPLRRVNQAYVITTSTSVDVSGVALPAALASADRKDEAGFFAAEKAKVLRGKAGFFAAQTAAVEKKAPVAEARKAAQAAVDKGVKLVAKGKDYTAYLKSTFSLSKSDKPHEMKF